MLTALFRGFVSQSIWIVEPVGRKLVERRIWIWRSFFVYRQFEDAFPNANLRKTRERCSKQKEQHELPSHRFHLKGINHNYTSKPPSKFCLRPGRSIQWNLSAPRLITRLSGLKPFFQTAEVSSIVQRRPIVFWGRKDELPPWLQLRSYDVKRNVFPINRAGQTPPPKVVM